MGQCISQPPGLPYEVEPEKDLEMSLFCLSDSEAYNRGMIGSRIKPINGIKGVTLPTDYLPSLKTKRRGSQDDSTCRLTKFSMARQGNPRGVSARILLTTKAPRLTQAGPPTLDILFQDHIRVRIGYQRMPSSTISTDADKSLQNSWMATSIHFGGVSFAKYRIQMTRDKFPFVVQLFENQSQKTCASLLTFGPEQKTSRIMHAFHDNVDTVEKAESVYYSKLFGVLDETKGVLAFQDTMTTDVEKAAFCIMLLMRARLLTFNGDW